MGIKLYRGDVVVCVLQKDYGKPRPAIIIQSNLFNTTHGSIVVCPITSHLVEAPMFRLRLHANKQSGIKINSQIMIDKMAAIKTEEVHKKIGRLSKSEMENVDHALRLWLNL